MASQTPLDTQDTELHEANWSLHWNPTVLSSLLNDPSTHDVTFKTSDGGNVSAHKAIVAASSPVFHDKLYIPDRPLLTLEDIDTATLSKLLTFIYSGKVTVNSTCLDKLLHAACYLKLTSLEIVLMKFAENSLNVNNIISVTILAIDRNCDQLQKCCQKFIIANMSAVARHPNFIALPHTVILEVCKSSDLHISEIDLFLAVAEWHKYQTLSKNFTKNIFQEIRYPLISSDDLIHKVRPKNLADSELFTAALIYHLDPSGYKGPPNQLVNRKYQLELSCSNESAHVSTTALPTPSPTLVSPDTSSSSVVPWQRDVSKSIPGSKSKSVTQSAVKRSKSFSRPVTLSASGDKPVTQPSVIINQEGEPQWHFNHYVCLYIYTVTPNVAIDLPVFLSTSARIPSIETDPVATTPRESHIVNTTRSASHSVATSVEQSTAITTSPPSTSSVTSSLGSATTPPSDPSASSASKKRVHRKRCGLCTGCNAEKCEVCINCTQPKRNKVCLKRRCSNLK
ncbi:uncharacterized protein [Dysidea avara]|uniref:uncharacterized protein isoform X3 n=1 Tax=Dysidea avara TaxID=196820 RepID=UPI0033314450